MLEEAILIATRAHMGQVDKGNQPYILHPLRVMLRLQTEEERTVGVLHDVIEDTSVTIEDLRKQGISKEVLEALEHITKGKQEPYMEYISRVIQNPLALKVKKCDLEDNMNRSRLEKVTEKDEARLKKYELAYSKVIEALKAYDK
ncbi:MAG: GTP pyrophosphokinase [Lachnospiraceae bacterium]|nr:GTP pyrophosphokinase [Lachnospiraceae bacterium]MEE1341151.1 GTP pyrophosphokinase [Lachnospiraceae bacterium]